MPSLSNGRHKPHAPRPRVDPEATYSNRMNASVQGAGTFADAASDRACITLYLEETPQGHGASRSSCPVAHANSRS